MWHAAKANAGRRAFDGKEPITSIFRGASEGEAIEGIKAILDIEAASERDNRGDDGFPTSELVLRALKRLKPHKGQLAMLEAHWRAENHTLSATQLAAAAGQANYSYANSQYGTLARELATEMEYTPPVSDPRTGDPIWTFALATGEREEVSFEIPDDYVEWKWKLRP